MSTQPLAPPTPSTSFSDRISLLIRRVGSATQIARMCGFSEGVVRSWRDGHTDPSRARCVTLARTLGISLVWLVAGEGAMQIDSSANNWGASQRNSDIDPSQRQRLGLNRPPANTAPPAALDAQRLNTAMRILQSELDLSNSPLTLGDNTDLLSELYELIGPGGGQLDSNAMVIFNQRLAERVRQGRETA